ncbi:MAG TPA: hypothetical protein VKJ47_07585 [Candidatus Binatia bacterium]|nr:hypothetical protein [Candidatus Binatia bacterium]
MRVQLLEHFRAFLLQAPLYTSTFLRVQEWSEPVLVMRVEELSRFQRGGYRARVGFRTWQSPGGTWVVAVPFCLEVPPQLTIKGMPCLNPRQAADSGVIEQFTRAQCIRFLFLSPDVADAADAQIAWPVAQRAQVRRLMQDVDAVLIGEKLTSAFDPDFAHARQEFQALLTTLEVPPAICE